LEYLSRADSIAMNLGTGNGHSVHDVVSAVEKVTGRKVPTHMGPRRAGDPAELVADPSRAEKLLNWKAKRSLEQIIASAWAWARRR
jgi:UDP-glucose 4-epimerase